MAENSVISHHVEVGASAMSPCNKSNSLGLEGKEYLFLLLDHVLEVQKIQTYQWYLVSVKADTRFCSHTILGGQR